MLKASAKLNNVITNLSINPDRSSSQKSKLSNIILIQKNAWPHTNTDATNTMSTTKQQMPVRAPPSFKTELRVESPVDCVRLGLPGRCSWQSEGFRESRRIKDFIPLSLPVPLSFCR